MKIEKQKKDRDRLRKNQEANARKHLSNVRVIQRNLVYVTNLPINTAREDVSTIYIL
jgi:CCR4-NOT transcription complex subunit 4